MKTFLLNFSVQTLDRKEKQEIDEDRSFSINYKISVNTAWNHCPVLINASLLCKHSSANLEALNKTSHEAPQGWLDREPPQEPRQLFLGTWDSPTGQGSEAHHDQGWRSGLCGPHPPLLLSPPWRRLPVHAGGMLVPPDGASLCCPVEMTAQQRLAEEEPQSASTCGYSKRMNLLSPSSLDTGLLPFLLGPSEKEVIFPFLAKWEIQATYRENALALCSGITGVWTTWFSF